MTDAVVVKVVIGSLDEPKNAISSFLTSKLSKKVSPPVPPKVFGNRVPGHKE